jgi:hypothetical protein
MLIHKKGFLRVVCMICLLAFLAADPLCAAAGNKKAMVPTNFELIEKVSAEAAQEIVSGLGALPGEGIVLLTRSKGAGDADFIMENALVKRLRDTRIRVSLEAPGGEDSTSAIPAYRLSYQVIRLSLAYPRISRRWWFGSKEVERAAKADIFAQLVNLKTSDILWVGESHKKYGDTIRFSMLPSVEEKQYEFTRPPRNEFKMMRLLEPVVVGGIVVGLVYLFFSNQSND